MKCKHWSIWSRSSRQMCASSRSPHPRYNELDAVSCLEERLSPNRLRGSEALREGRDTDLSPFCAPWEFCFIRTDAAETPFARRRCAGPFSSGISGGRETRRIRLSEPRCHGRGFFYSSARLSIIRRWLVGQLSSADQGDGASGEENVLTSALGKLSDIYSLPT